MVSAGVAELGVRVQDSRTHTHPCVGLTVAVDQSPSVLVHGLSSRSNLAQASSLGDWLPKGRKPKLQNLPKNPSCTWPCAILTAQCYCRSKPIKRPAGVQGESKRPHLLKERAAPAQLGRQADPASTENLPSGPQAWRLLSFHLRPPGPLALLRFTDLFILSQLPLFLWAPSSNTAALERCHQPWGPLTSMSSESVTNYLELLNP